MQIVTFSTAWTVVDAIRNLLPTVIAKHLPDDDFLRWTKMAEMAGSNEQPLTTSTTFSYPMVHLDNSPQPPRFLWYREDILTAFAVRFFFLPWGFSFCREVFLFAVSLFLFAVSLFLFAVSLFLFCREVILFAASLFLFAASPFLFAVRFFFLP